MNKTAAERARKGPVYLPILHDEAKGIYFVEMRAVVDGLWRPGNPIPNGIAVYWYVDGCEVVYVGEGKLPQRFGELRRRSWIFDYVEFMLVKTKEDGPALEFVLLDEFERLFGRLPRYNSKRGRSPKKQ